MSKKIETDKLQEAIDAVEKYGSIAEAAKALKIPRKTLSGRYNKSVDRGYKAGGPSLTAEQRIGVEAKMRRTNQEKRRVIQQNKELHRLLEEKETELNTLLGFKDSLFNISSEPIKVVDSGKPSQSTAVALLSDFHGEETVDPRTVDNLNEYNRTIAEQRLEKFFQNLLKLVDMSRSKSDIETLVLWLGGDFITGYIHEELMEGNSLSPPDATLWVYKLLISGIDFLLEHGDFKHIIIPTNVGNHGRTTQKRRVATSVQNSFEWMLYNFLSLHYAENERIKFKLTRGYFNILDIYGYKIRFHHGDNVRFFGAVGGLTIPLNKAISQWSKAERVDLDVLGHFHQRICSKSFVVNGSIIGYGPYAQSIKAEYERPQQTFFLIHPKWGRTLDCPIFLE